MHERPPAKTDPTIIIADDHPLYRLALRLGIETLAPAALILEVDSFESLRRMAQQTRTVDLVLLDLMMPGAVGLSSLQYLRDTFPQLPVAVVSSLPTRSWLRLAQSLGAVAYIHKSATPEQMVAILRRVLAGEPGWPAHGDPVIDDSGTAPLDRLSPQELRVLLQLQGGRLNKQIAGRLGISESTVKTHVSAILHKLGLSSRTQAAVLAQQLLTTELR
ncbi:response regulator transcription factor [Nevskia sp.]|uniref:LuxR C-terminal-related transcriptional regulator n=1 Tax=Nevskia sp. TaxID=1929292 RepID=UPI0025EDBC93|nr:response regulator transcription factor [Nevskia sp.]